MFWVLGFIFIWPVAIFIILFCGGVLVKSLVYESDKKAVERMRQNIIAGRPIDS